MHDLLGLRIFEACGANIADLGEEHGHRVLKIRGKGDKTVLATLPPAVARAIEHAVEGRQQGADPAQYAPHPVRSRHARARYTALRRSRVSTSSCRDQYVQTRGL